MHGDDDRVARDDLTCGVGREQLYRWRHPGHDEFRLADELPARVHADGHARPEFPGARRAGGDSFSRGVATDSSGNAQIYNGTFLPSLTTLNPSTSTFSNHTLSGWSTVNNLNYGGIVVAGNYAYASDMFTFNGGEPNGIVRFDLTNFSATRFAMGSANWHGDYITVGLGLNGLLYALWPGGSPEGNHIDVINPATMTVVKTIDLPFTFSLTGVTADEQGNIYAVGALGDGHIYKLDGNGNVLAEISTGFTGLNGLELSNSGQLLTASNDGEVITTNTSFSQLSSFSVGSQITTFDAFVTPPTVGSVPEPASATLLSIGVAVVAYRISRRRRS